MGFHLDHIGIAVASIADALVFYRDALGLQVDRTEEVTEQQVRVAFLATGQCHIELLEPTSPESPIAKFMARRGSGIHHVCVQVQDIKAVMARLAQRGFTLIDADPRPGADNKWVAFVHPKATGGVLLELSEPMNTSEPMT